QYSRNSIGQPVKRSQISVVAQRRSEVVKQFSAEVDHDRPALLIGKIQRAVQLQVVHDEQVAAPEIQDALAHLKMAGAAHGTENFQPVVPCQAFAGHECFIRERLDSKRKLRVE